MIVNPLLVGIACLLATLCYLVVAVMNSGLADDFAFVYIILVVTFMLFKDGHAGA